MDFIPTLGNKIAELDKIIENIPPDMREDCARLFEATEIQRLLFSTQDFKEEAFEYCSRVGWKAPR